MSSRGQSLSMFVVQRSFSRVLRGYDPDEVDRHLELVRDASAEAERILAEARAAAERELIARREREQRLADVRAEAAALAERLREQADEELQTYTDRRRREADRLAQAARRERREPPL